MVLMPTYRIKPVTDYMVEETPKILKALSIAHRHLAELKGRAASIPNQGILIDTLSLQEAQASSEIENIITTQDELFEIGSGLTGSLSPEQKEVARYREALKHGSDMLLDKQGLITNNSIVGMFQILKQSTGEFRATPGTTLKNDLTGETVYVPPQSRAEIAAHMADLESFLNIPERSALDPLVKMALLHHQFESIHPFPDGNGRIGRILNVLYLVQQDLLDIPVLYLSRYITRHKSEYYRLLQHVRDHGEWEDWIIYMISAVAETSRDTVQLVIGIRALMSDYKSRMRERHKNIYSQDLLNNVFRHPYTRIEYVVEECQVGRQAAARYLDRLASDGMLVKIKRGLNNYYVNVPLVDLLAFNGAQDS
jgi:Fic family protein